MADEITAICGLSFSKGGRKASFDTLRQSLDMSGNNYIQRDHNIGTSAEALDIGEITTPGLCAFINHDTTNYVTVRMGASGADVVKLLAGEMFVFRLASTTPHAIANTAACDCSYLIIEA